MKAEKGQSQGECKECGEDIGEHDDMVVKEDGKKYHDYCADAMADEADEEEDDDKDTPPGDTDG